MERKCMFCGAGEVTAEHAWPGWLASHVPPAPEGWEPHAIRGTANNFQSFPQAPFALKVKCVCSSCNHGWLADLERAVESILTSLIQGKSRALEPPTQRILATWAYKTYLVMKLAITPAVEWADGALVKSGAYRKLLETGTVPDRAVVLIGHIPDPPFWPTYFRSVNSLPLGVQSVATPGPVIEEGVVLMGILGLGELVMVVGETTFPTFRTEIEIDDQPGLVRIWPPPLMRPVKFPPPEVMDSDAVNRVGNGLRAMFDELP